MSATAHRQYELSYLGPVLEHHQDRHGLWGIQAPTVMIVWSNRLTLTTAPLVWHPQTFTSAGSDNVWETFTIAEPIAIRDFDIIALSGPTFTNFPNYPALRVVDFQVVGQLPANTPGYFNVRRRGSSRSRQAFGWDVQRKRQTRS